MHFLNIPKCSGWAGHACLHDSITSYIRYCQVLETFLGPTHKYIPEIIIPSEISKEITYLYTGLDVFCLFQAWLDAVYTSMLSIFFTRKGCARVRKIPALIFCTESARKQQNQIQKILVFIFFKNNSSSTVGYFLSFFLLSLSLSTYTYPPISVSPPLPFHSFLSFFFCNALLKKHSVVHW